MTHLRRASLATAAVMLLIAFAPSRVFAVTPLYTQGEAALDRSMNDFYSQAVAGPVTSQRLDALEKKIVQPVVQKYDEALLSTWKTTVEKRIRLADENAAEAGRRSLQNPAVAKALGLAPGSAPAAGDAGSRRSRGGSTSTSEVETHHLTVDGTNVPKVIEFEEKKKPKRTYQPYIPKDSH